jgi:phage terminase large subunit-like protein
MDSVNNYQNLNVISERTEKDLVKALRSFQYPIALHHIVVNNNKWYAFYSGNVNTVSQSVTVEKVKQTQTIRG